MYKITIEQITTENYTETENFVTKEIPTAERKPKDYGNGSEVVFHREYAVREVAKKREVTRTILKQELPDDGFNLANVIKAVNGL